MTIKKRPLSADGTSMERRKSRRFPVVVPLEVSWRGSDGSPVKQEAVARQVNANGGYLKMEVYPDSGTRVTLANFLSAQTAEARVLAAPHAREGVANGIVVELIAPNESFWGADLQVEKTSLELQNLEKALQFEDVDLRLLKEYRDAVNAIRKAASTVQRLRECQLRGVDDAELHVALAAERIRRAMDLCAEVVADLDAGRVTKASPDVTELARTLEYLRGRITREVQGEAAAPTNDSRQPKLAAPVPIGRKAR